MSENTHAYIGIKECGCVVACVVDSAEHIMDVSTTIAGWGRHKPPLKPKRVTIEEARSMLARCTHAKKVKARNGK